MQLDYQVFESPAKALLKKIAAELNTRGNIEYAFRITRSVFHVLRDVISLENSLALMAELPDDFKRLYSDEWDISQDRVQFETTQEFYRAVREYGTPDLPALDLHDGEMRQTIQAVFTALHSPGTQPVLDRIKKQFPLLP